MATKHSFIASLNLFPKFWRNWIVLFLQDIKRTVFWFYIPQPKNSFDILIIAISQFNNSLSISKNYSTSIHKVNLIFFVVFFFFCLFLRLCTFIFFYLFVFNLFYLFKFIFTVFYLLYINRDNNSFLNFFAGGRKSYLFKFIIGFHIA